MSAATILVVDDDAQFRAAICRGLRAEGYAVEEAGGGAEALRMVTVRPPAMLITDIFMPDQDGFELITAIKAEHKTMRILAISGHGNLPGFDALGLAAQLGVDATFAKPFSPAELYAKVAELIGPGAPA